MNQLYGKFFKSPYPARTTLQQNLETDDEAAEQISFIAVGRHKGIVAGSSNGPLPSPSLRRSVCMKRWAPAGQK
jgi:hypothetical protein